MEWAETTEHTLTLDTCQRKFYKLVTMVNAYLRGKSGKVGIKKIKMSTLYVLTSS